MARTAAAGAQQLVGRDREIASIDRAIGDLQAGRGQVIMLAGEAGIGKSALARYAADSARQASIPVYRGFAWEAGGAPAYWPWTQLLSSLVEEQMVDFAAPTGLGQLLPGSGSPDEGPTLQPDQARFQLLESVRRLLDDISRRTPLVLVFEDLHAADVDSLQLLQYVAGHVTALPVLIVGTFRDVEARAMAAGEPLWRTCRDAEVLTLARLAENDVRRYLGLRGSEAVSDRDIHRLLQTTEGNPLFLTELVGLLAQQRPGEIQLPASVQQVIRQQIALLPEHTRSRLAHASVIGREFDIASLAALTGKTADKISTDLNIALESALLRKTSGGRFRFSHVLHRDVLYHDIDAAERQSLHDRYGRYLRRFIDSGDEDRWTELAEHLGAGSDDNADAAIDAWRKAARRALKRLAFEDAVVSLNKAFALFGEGPRYSPKDRFELLLECASATFLTGNTEAGNRYCRDAFDIARTLQDAEKMTRAALTWGSVVVVARVDSELIAALRECLAALPPDAIALRATVQARLAGALQPAPNPAEPMEMAREALALSRTSGDEQVQYSVLRSAISAFMDFAPADERLAMNEELGPLAERFGDVSCLFRSKLRLMIDACEVADRTKMDRAIEECYHLAERIGLPHYRWRAASARAMQATIDGDFARATTLLDVAQAFADQIDDVEARITLPLQRFAILIEWDAYDGESLDDIEARLALAYESGMPDAEFFVAPFVNSYRYPLTGETATRLLGNTLLIERSFSGGDRFSLCRLGEIAAVAKDTDLAKRAYERCLPFVEHCATMGIMGSCGSGPIATSLGIIAAGLGDFDTALAHLDKALAIAQSMRAPAWTARIHLMLADVAADAGRQDVASRHAEAGRRQLQKLQMRELRLAPGEAATAAVTAMSNATFGMAREGELWRVSYGRESALLRRSKGLDLLAKLIERPERDIHVLDLTGSGAVRDEGPAGPAVDPQARAAYERRLRELEEALAEAEAFNDIGSAEAARTEIDFIGSELSRAFGLGGRERRSGSAAERARVNVRRQLKNAIERVSKQMPEAGRYLENTIKTGTYCRYASM
jgi:tetratricopeptide (TPR) repeat protein